MIDKADFLFWKNADVTKGLFSYLKIFRKECEESLLMDLNEDPRNIQRQIARINLIDQLLNIDYSDLTGLDDPD